MNDSPLPTSGLQYRSVDMCAPETHDDPWEMYEYLRENDPN